MKFNMINLVLSLIAFPMIVGAPDALAGKLPETLICTGIRFLKGDQGHGFDNPETYFPVTIHPGMATTAMGGPDIEAVPNGVVKITYSDSDQYETYRFKQADLDLLEAGQRNSIHGIFEDGYDWTNGYNVRARFLISCHT